MSERKDHSEQLAMEGKSQSSEVSVRSNANGLADDEIDLFELFAVLWRERYKIVLVTAVFAVISVFYALNLPNVYQATASFTLPQDNSSRLSSLMSQLSSLPFISAGKGSSSESAFEIIEAYLKKQENIWRVVEQFDLKEHYNLPLQYLDKRYFKERLEMKSPVEKVYLKALSLNNDKKSSIVKLSFSDKNPYKATDIANYNVELIREISLNTASTENRRKREFLEERLKAAHQELTDIEEEVKNYMQKNRILSVQSQADATISAVSKLQSEMMLNQLKINVKMQLGASNHHPEIKMLNLENDALQKQLKAIEEGGSALDQSMLDEEQRSKVLTYLPLGTIPQLQLDLARLNRELAVRQEVFKALAKEYEMAKIESAKDQEFVEVIEWAILPETKDQPRRSLICLVATFSGFLLACFGVLVVDALLKRKMDARA